MNELSKFAQRYAKAWCSRDPTTFPNMVVTFDKLEPRDGAVAFHWTLTGTNTGPGGTGNKVQISGYELWKIDNDGLIGESKGHFDAADYERQLSQK